jgi:hypothetical protein
LKERRFPHLSIRAKAYNEDPEALDASKKFAARVAEIRAQADPLW